MILQKQGLFGCLRTVIKGDSRGRAWRGQTGLSWTWTTIGRSNTWWRYCYDEDDDDDDEEEEDGGGDHLSIAFNMFSMLYHLVEIL